MGSREVDTNKLADVTQTDKGEDSEGDTGLPQFEEEAVEPQVFDCTDDPHPTAHSMLEKAAGISKNTGQENQRTMYVVSSDEESSGDSDTEEDWESAPEDTPHEDTTDKLKFSFLQCLKPRTDEDINILPRDTSAEDPTSPANSRSGSLSEGTTQNDTPVSAQAGSGSPSSGRRYVTNKEFQAERCHRILKKYPDPSDSRPAQPQVLKPDPFAEDEAEFTYDMQHKKRGVFVIINNKTFSIKGVEERSGTDVDADKLERTFSRLGFETRRRNNLSCAAMKSTIEKVAREDHSNADCFGCAVLSHGDEGIVYGTDQIMQIDTLTQPIKECRSLVGKPKLFFIQACRGCKFDEGVDMPDGATEPQPQRIPLQADCLYAYSTTPGYFSWRNKIKGSWFIQALCNILDFYGDRKEVMWLMTRVNRCVAKKYESRCSDKALDKKKQIPSIVSQLTKQVFFLPKYPKLEQSHQGGLAEPQVVGLAQHVPVCANPPSFQSWRQTPQTQSQTIYTTTAHVPVPANAMAPNELVRGGFCQTSPQIATTVLRQEPRQQVCLPYRPNHFGESSAQTNPPVTSFV